MTYLFTRKPEKPVDTNEATGEVTEYEMTTITVDYNSTQTLEGKIGANQSLIYFLSVVGLLAFVTIFLYKKRPLQLRLVFAILVMSIIVLVFYVPLKFLAMHILPSILKKSLLAGALIPVAMFVFGLLSYKRIQKDEKLVRSLDRIR